MAAHQLVVELDGRHRSAIGRLVAGDLRDDEAIPLADAGEEIRCQIRDSADRGAICPQGAHRRLVKDPAGQAAIVELGILIRPGMRGNPQVHLRTQLQKRLQIILRVVIQKDTFLRLVDHPGDVCAHAIPAHRLELLQAVPPLVARHPEIMDVAGAEENPLSACEKARGVKCQLFHWKCLFWLPMPVEEGEFIVLSCGRWWSLRIELGFASVCLLAPGGFMGWLMVRERGRHRLSLAA